MLISNRNCKRKNFFIRYYASICDPPGSPETSNMEGIGSKFRIEHILIGTSICIAVMMVLATICFMVYYIPISNTENSSKNATATNAVVLITFDDVVMSTTDVPVTTTDIATTTTDVAVTNNDVECLNFKANRFIVEKKITGIYNYIKLIIVKCLTPLFKLISFARNHFSTN